MVEKFKGSIRLDWINRDKSLYYEIDEEEGKGVKPTWVDKNDIKVSEPRVLKLVKEIGDVSNLKNSLHNVLIRGDNLLALRTLVELFKNRDEKDKVKCIYIDPPYNTGNAFDDYDDNLQHSEWLTMMRDRLLLLKKLMRKDGVIYIQIDDDEQAYLRVLMDEIFGRKNYLAKIAVKCKSPAGVGQESYLFEVYENILVYAKEEKFAINNIKYFDEIMNRDTMGGYNLILKDSGKSTQYKKYESSRVGTVNIYKHIDYKIERLTKLDITKEFMIKNFDRLFQTTNPQGGLVKKILPQLEDRGLYTVEYIPSKGKNQGKLSKLYFYTNRIFVWLKDGARVQDNELIKKIKSNNLWLDIGWHGISSEGGVTFLQSKKPEKLIKRIIEMSTKEGDLVLDSFAGSGTTGAVAQKLGRLWIMVELGKHAEDLCMPRLKSVVDGSDQSGISKDVNWQGGGGFRYYKLSDSLIKDQDLNWELNHEGEDIAKSIFMTFDFRFKERMKEGIFIGKSGKKIALGILSKDLKIIQKNELKVLIKEVSKKYPYDHLTIYTNCGIAIKDEDIDESLDIKKVPEIILKKYKM